MPAADAYEEIPEQFMSKAALKLRNNIKTPEEPIDPTMPFNNFTSGSGALSAPTDPVQSQTGIASVAEKQLHMTKKYWCVCATHAV